MEQQQNTPEQNTPEQNERNALRILALATEQYLKTADELSRNFVAPQANAAVEILVNALNDRWTTHAVVSSDAQAAQATVTKRGK